MPRTVLGRSLEAVVLQSAVNIPVGRATWTAGARFLISAARSVALAVVWLVPFHGCLCSWAAEPRPRSILVLDQSDVRSPFYSAIFAGLRSTVTQTSGTPVSVLVESLNLGRFNGAIYEESLKSHLRVKYADQPRRSGLLLQMGLIGRA